MSVLLGRVAPCGRKSAPSQQRGRVEMARTCICAQLALYSTFGMGELSSVYETSIPLFLVLCELSLVDVEPDERLRVIWEARRREKGFLFVTGR
jgi:hypothetical protein